MDLFDTDRKLSDLSETQFDDFLESDIFTPPPNTTEAIMDFSLDNGLDHDIDVTDHGMDQDWLDTFFDPVLNDRMISDALQPPPHVQSEHSYSLANNEQALDMSIKKEDEKDLERELLGTTVNPNSMTPTTPTMIVPQSTAPTSLLTTAATRTINQQQQQVSSKLSGTTNSSIIKTNVAPNAEVKTEPVDQETTMVTVTRTTNPHTLLKPTIILATQSTLNSQHHPQIVSSHNSQNITTAHIKQERIVLPKSTTLTTSGLPVTSAVTVKVEPVHTMSSSTSSASSPDINYDAISLPPTPPSSNTSDSEGCQSPERSLPSSPVRQSLYASRTAYRATPSPPPYHGGSQPFLMHPIPSSGVLMLSEEEKRTLITEGYPIPSKLPLSKTEEKNLKKIRRKIKNKISAQESRRKKKEYLESLERKVESFCQENVDLKKKVDSLENSNRSLLSQLHKLQTLVGKIRPQNASVPGSCLMVLVLCFAVFLGSWSPSSISVGYSSVSGSISSAPSGLVGPDPRRHLGDDGTLLGGLVDTVLAPDGGAMAGSLSKHSSHGDGLSDNTGNSEHRAASTNGESIAMLPENANPYSTPKMKSRVLLSIEEESDSNEAVYGPSAPFCLQDMLTRWFNLGAKAVPSTAPTATESDTLRFDPTLPKINTLDVEMEINQTGNEDQQGQGHFAKSTGQQGSSEEMAAGNEKAIMHPDISVMTPSRQVNTTA